VKILGIETSCDETSAAVVEDGKRVLSSIVSSQAELHSKYGGVIPEIASRKQLELIQPVVDSAIQEAKVSLSEIDGIAVVNGPGLLGSLFVGLVFAKSLAYAWKKPLVGINHVEAHIFAGFLVTDIQFPFLALVVSGGHTSLYHVLSHNRFELLGRTVDDAAGEAFDKVAKLLGLGYPGGPLIQKLAENGDPSAIKFPLGMVRHQGFDFSFSGLKTAVLTYTKKNKKFNPADVAASFQHTVVKILIKKIKRALLKTRAKTLVLAGGVAANKALRNACMELEDEELKVVLPPLEYCTDNAAMVACLGYYRLKAGMADTLELDVFSTI
jgi:N6-L-threonylcarbamoyladenine synthase